MRGRTDGHASSATVQYITVMYVDYAHYVVHYYSSSIHIIIVHACRFSCWFENFFVVTNDGVETESTRPSEGMINKDNKKHN
jgi:hypothetical protein